jgi:hypothetical protein
MQKISTLGSDKAGGFGSEYSYSAGERLGIDVVIGNQWNKMS